MTKPFIFHPVKEIPMLPLAVRGVRDKRRDLTTLFESMTGHGRFITDSTGESFFFDTSSKSVIPLSADSQKLARFLGGYRLVADTAVVDYIRQYAIARGSQAEVHRIATVNTVDMKIYVHSQGASVYRVTQSGIEVIHNGDDNIYFLAEENSAPFSLVDILPTEDQFHEYLLKPLRPSETVMSADQAQFMLLGWFTALFVPELLPVSPILALAGTASSGKTTFLNHIQLLLFGQQQPVTRQPADGKGLDALTAGRGFLCLDHVTDWGPWLEDRLESIARRETVLVKAGKSYVPRRFDCSMAMTTRQLPDSSFESLNLLLPVMLERPEQQLPEMAMRRQVLAARDIIMTQTLVRLQRLLIHIARNPDGYRGSFLMSDFADLIYRLAHTIGYDKQAVEALDACSALQTAVLPIEQNAELIRMWVGIAGNEGRKVKATELHQELSVIAKDRGVKVPMDERPFAHWLKKNIESIGRLFSVSMYEGRSRQLFYVIRNLTKIGTEPGKKP